MNDTRQTRESITTQKLSLYQNVLGFDDAALIASGIGSGAWPSFSGVTSAERQPTC